MSKFWVIPKDLNFTHKYMISCSGRGGGKRYYQYKILSDFLEHEGEYISRGFTTPLEPHQESYYNNILVNTIKFQESFRRG